MKLKTRVLGFSAAAVMATSLVAGAAYAGPPVIKTGDTLYNGPQFAVMGTCSYILVGSAKAADGSGGLQAVQKAVTISLKNYPVASGNYGSCTGLDGRTGASASSLSIASGSVKLVSAATSPARFLTYSWPQVPTGSPEPPRRYVSDVSSG